MKTKAQSHILSLSPLLSFIILLGCMNGRAPQVSPPSMQAPIHAAKKNPYSSVQSTQWRIRNIGSIGDHWNIGELEMFIDEACTEAKKDVQEVLYSHWYDDSPKTVVYDGACNTMGHANPNTWAGGDQGEHVLDGGSWLGYRFEKAQTIRCIRICQGEDQSQRVERATLEYFDGQTWIPYGELSLSAGESKSLASNQSNTPI